MIVAPGAIGCTLHGDIVKPITALCRTVCCAVALLPLFAHAERPSGATYVGLSIVKNFPVVTVAINGKPVQLMVDMVGNGQVSLSAEVITTLAIEPTASKDDWLDADGKKLNAARFRVAEFQIGNLVFHNISGHEDIDAPGYRRAAVGVGHFGPSLLQGYKVVLDYKHLAMVLIPADSGRAARYGCVGAAVPFLSQWKGEPVTRASTSFGDLTMVWDTGAPFSLLRKSKLPTDVKPRIDGQYRSDTFDLGDSRFGPLEVLAAEFGEPAALDGFVGYNFLVKNSVCVDLPAKQLLVKRN